MKLKGIIIAVISIIVIIAAVIFWTQGFQNSAISREEVVNQALEQISTEQTLLFDTLEEIGQSVQHGRQPLLRCEPAALHSKRITTFTWLYRLFVKRTRHSSQPLCTKT